MPIVSGNVSLYNETKNDDGTGSAILPTPAIGAVGLLEDWEKSATIGFVDYEQAICLVGGTRSDLGQSLWLREILSCEAGSPPVVDLELERRIGEEIRHLIEVGRVTAVHDISDGGILVTIAEMALASGIGAELVNAAYSEDRDTAAFWFGEAQAGYVVTWEYDKFEENLEDYLTSRGIPARHLGDTCTEGQVQELYLADVENDYDHQWSIPLADLRAAHEGFFPKLMSNEL